LNQRSQTSLAFETPALSENTALFRSMWGQPGRWFLELLWDQPISKGVASTVWAGRANGKL